MQHGISRTREGRGRPRSRLGGRRRRRSARQEDSGCGFRHAVHGCTYRFGSRAPGPPATTRRLHCGWSGTGVPSASIMHGRGPLILFGFKHQTSLSGLRCGPGNKRFRGPWRWPAGAGDSARQPTIMAGMSRRAVDHLRPDTEPQAGCGLKSPVLRWRLASSGGPSSGCFSEGRIRGALAPTPPGRSRGRGLPTARPVLPSWWRPSARRPSARGAACT